VWVEGRGQGGGWSVIFVGTQEITYPTYLLTSYKGNIFAISLSSLVLRIVLVCDGAEFKNKLTGVWFIFNLRKININQYHESGLCTRTIIIKHR
jgi:hypothetical protein